MSYNSLKHHLLLIRSEISQTSELFKKQTPPQVKNHHTFIVASGKAAEYGILKEGYMFESSTGLSRILSRLLSSPPYPVLEALGKKLSFEIAVGINGRFWVNASQPSTVILVGNAIQKSESLSMVQQKIYVEKLLKSIQ